MARPALLIEHLDFSADAPSVLGNLSEMVEGAFLDMGAVPLLSRTERHAFRVRVTDWNGAPHVTNVRVLVENTELPQDQFLVGFTDNWADRSTVALSAAPAEGADPPASWDLTPEKPVSGYCVIQFVKSAVEYPGMSFGGDGIGALRVGIKGVYD